MSFQLPANRPALMGILNVTSDSFSDGGQFLDASTAIDRGLQMVDQGADLIDIGGESTRPGAEETSVEDEWGRVSEPIRFLSQKGIAISVDTSKTEVARRAIAEGAIVVNDVTALKSSGMAELCAAENVTVCLMHMQGTPRTMQQSPHYVNVVQEVQSFLVQRVQFAEQAGINKGQIWIDPGIGFGKSVSHNLSLLANLEYFCSSLNAPVLVGLSRKSFIGKLLGTEEHPVPIEERLEGTLAFQAIAHWKGTRIFRTHDVLESKRALDAVTALRNIGTYIST